jgi:Ca-activated chloride channel family protein
MRFAEANALLFLIVPLVAGAGMLFQIFSRRRALERLGEARTVEQQLVRGSAYLRAVKGIALLVGLAGLALAAARPQYGGRIQMLKKRGIDVVVALDFSKSMLATDIRPSRIERAKLELADFIAQLTGDRIGLVAYAGDVIRFPLTTDYAAATAFWKNMGPYDMPVGGTAIGKALTAATRMLVPGEPKDPGSVSDQTGRSRVILLITDGEDHEGDPLAAADEAAKQGIRVHALGIGSDSPELIPRYLDDGTPMGYQKDQDGNYVTTALSAKNEEVLQEVASKTGGRYYRAGSDLGGMARIVEEIRKLKQSEVSSRQVTVYEEVFQWFLLPAIALVALGLALPERISRRKRRNA